MVIDNRYWIVDFICLVSFFVIIRMFMKCFGLHQGHVNYINLNLLLLLLLLLIIIIISSSLKGMIINTDTIPFLGETWQSFL